MSEQEIEIKEAYITPQSYPILWVGENGYNISRYGKLLRIKPSYYKGEEELRLVIPTIDFESKDFVFKPNELYIVAGGVNPDLLIVKEIIYASREEDILSLIYGDLNLPASTKYQFASGIKKKGYAIIYERVYSSDIFEPLQFKYNFQSSSEFKAATPLLAGKKVSSFNPLLSLRRYLLSFKPNESTFNPLLSLRCLSMLLYGISKIIPFNPLLSLSSKYKIPVRERNKDFQSSSEFKS